MVGTLVRKGESIDTALRRFRQKVQRAGIRKAVRRASYYMKPSEKKKIAKRRAARRHRRH